MLEMLQALPLAANVIMLSALSIVGGLSDVLAAASRHIESFYRDKMEDKKVTMTVDPVQSPIGTH